MAIIPLFGHGDLRDRFREAVHRGILPATLLLQGRRGVGKQRLALWLAQLLLCDRSDTTSAPCGNCRACHFCINLSHPDLHWFFPRPRLKDSAPDLDDVRADNAESIAERVREHGLYAPPSGSEGIFIVTVRVIVQQAVLSPAIGQRKVFIVGDAERMVSQEGSEQAANAFLKLLEEPPPNTTVILTSSEPGALLPTVRSRAVSLRVAPLGQDEVREFLECETVASALNELEGVPSTPAERVLFAGGAPGRLLAAGAWTTALRNARQMLGALSSTASAAAIYEAAWSQSSTKARGAFADTLDALTLELHQRSRTSIDQGAESAAAAAARAVELVEVVKERVASNVSPPLLTVNLLRELRELLT